MKIKPIIFLLTLTLFSTLSYGGKFYKWTDDDGNIHYSDKEPVGKSAETVHVNSSRPSGKPYKLPSQFSPNQGDGPPDEEAATQNEQEEEAMREYCKNLRSNIKALEVGGRVKTVDEEGNIKYLNDEEREDKLNKYKKQISENCQY